MKATELTSMSVEQLEEKVKEATEAAEEVTAKEAGGEEA